MQKLIWIYYKEVMAFRWVRCCLSTVCTLATWIVYATYSFWIFLQIYYMVIWNSRKS